MKHSPNGAGRSGRPPATLTPRASVRDLHVSFRRRGVALHAVRGVSIEIAAGEIVALVGESGAGKSVLGLSLLGLPTGDPPAALTGRAEVCGVDMVAASPAERRRIRRAHLGAVFQNPMTSLNPTMRIGDQVREVAGSTAEAGRLLELAGIPQARNRLRSYPHELSGRSALRVGTGGRGGEPHQSLSGDVLHTVERHTRRPVQLVALGEQRVDALLESGVVGTAGDHRDEPVVRHPRVLLLLLHQVIESPGYARIGEFRWRAGDSRLPESGRTTGTPNFVAPARFSRDWPGLVRRTGPPVPAVRAFGDYVESGALGAWSVRAGRGPIVLTA